MKKPVKYVKFEGRTYRMNSAAHKAAIAASNRAAAVLANPSGVFDLTSLEGATDAYRRAQQDYVAARSLYRAEAKRADRLQYLLDLVTDQLRNRGATDAEIPF